MSVCTSIVKLSDSTNGDLLEVTIDNSITALWFYDYADSMQFLNQEVIVEYRKDVYDGQLRQFIKTFTVPTVVNTLEKQDGFKLYLDQQDNECNLAFSEIQSGETRPGCIVFCVAQEYKSSAHAVWMELLIRDKTMHVAKLRIFDYESDKIELAGHYIIGELSRNKYGFQTDRVVVAPGEIRRNPEIDIALQFIKNYFSTDVPIMTFLNQTNLLEAMLKHVDYEEGYVLVRLAMELAMCEALNNITKDVDVQAIGQILLLSYAHLARPSSVLSPVVNNVFLAQQVMLSNRRLVVTCLDECLAEHEPEYAVVKNIQSSVAKILEIRKGCLL
ncbi:MAG: hypothetical protein NC548_31470 [Lachnospiraceae bacterium]|nr:hypothetical protein [Lachnospiraceae bacterium]